MIQHNKPFLDRRDLLRVKTNLQSGLIATGETVGQFEQAMIAYLGNKREACAVSSGTSALFLALWALGVKKGDEVITSTYVCSAVLNAIVMCQANPVLVDIKENDFNLDPQQVKKAITRRTKAIIAPHIYGCPADIKALKKFRIPIVEDCAQAIGQKMGAMGDVSIFSFYATKLLTTGHGGMIVSSSRKMIEKIKDYREFDCRKDYYPRFNFKMTDFQAALGLSQLKKLNQFLAKRKKIAAQYKKVCDRYRVGYQESEGDRIYYRFVIRHPQVQALKKAFLKQGIKTIIPVESWELLHQYLKKSGRDFPNAEKVVATTLSLPLYPTMTNAEINKTVTALERALRNL